MSIKVAVVGCGYWGPNLVRTFVEIPEASLVAVSARDPTRLGHIRSRYPQIRHFTPDYHDLLDLDLDAVVVSTPPETHFDIVSTFLDRGLDVLVEKPLATRTEHAVRLVDLAEAADRILMVGHIGAYNPVVQALKDMIEDGQLGKIRYVDGVRVGLGAFHPTLNVIWDLAPHEISILLHILGETPTTVSTRAIACVEESIEDVAYMTLTFPSGILAHSRMSWLDPRKTRRITVVGSNKMAVYDDLETLEKLKVYDKRVKAVRPTETFGDFQFAYHYGSVVSPYVQLEEPLRLECLHFLECVKEHKRPITDGPNGVAVVRIIEAAQRSLKAGGLQVSIGDHAAAQAPVAVSSLGAMEPVGHNGHGGPAGKPIYGSHPNGARANGNGRALVATSNGHHPFPNGGSGDGGLDALVDLAGTLKDDGKLG
jgi:predicted dehydrogenase